MADLSKLNIAGARRGLKNKEFSSEELTKACFGKIKERNDELNAFLEINEDEALVKAKEVDGRIAAGYDVGELAGIPCSLKDVVCVEGMRATAASNILKDYSPPFDAVVAERLKKSDVVILGKTNTDEFTCGASTETSAFGVTRNPVNPECVPGGSSGGSAASVAADMSLFSIGTDTGGSIRQPASFCGVVGLKVTYGRVPRSGVISMASSWDTVGPLTKTVEDAAYVLNVIAGASEMDSTTPKVDVPDYTANLEKSVKGLKIGVPKEFFIDGLDEEVEKSVRDAIEVLKKQGAVVSEISLPTTKYAVAVYYVLTPSEVSANMARYDGIRYGSVAEGEFKNLEEFYFKNRSAGFGDEMKRRIMIGTYALSSGYYDAYYKKAQKVRTLIIEDFKNVFNDVDVVMGPVAPTPAFKLGEKVDDPLAMYLADVFTIPASAAGIPALSVPCGKSSGGLPIGLQIMGPQFAEEKVLNVGNIYEKARGDL